MKRLFTAFLLILCFTSGFAQLQIEDTLNVTSDRWRDTCFGLIDKSVSQIPNGYLLDYSMADFETGKLDGVGTNDTIKAFGDFFYYYHILEASSINENATLPYTDDLYVDAMLCFFVVSILNFNHYNYRIL